MDSRKPKLVSKDGTTVPQPERSALEKAGCASADAAVAEGLRLVRAFEKISDAKQRQAIIVLAEALMDRKNT